MNAIEKLMVAASARPLSTASEPLSRQWESPGHAAKALLESTQYAELLVEVDPHERVVWYFMRPTTRPSATVGLMRDIAHMQDAIRTLFDTFTDPANPPVRYTVLGSRMPGIFNLGGDLALFARLIREKNRDALTAYARLSIDVIHANCVNLNLPLISASVVQGDALGGGFEAALSSNLIVAEQSAKFGLPEVLFNLFPGMGAYSFLSRRIDPAKAEKMLLSGRIYSAGEMHEMGVVDVLAADGQGEQALYDYIDKHGRQYFSHRAIYQVRRRVQPITYEEMADITDIWVDTAMTIGEEDLARMERLAAAQDRRWAKGPRRPA